MTDYDRTPEQRARAAIDTKLEQAGWCVQSMGKIDFGAGAGIAVREYPTDVGPADYVLFIDSRAVGVIEAKREEWGHKITAVEEQSGAYAAATLKWVNNSEPLPFVYESTGVVTRFTNRHDPAPRSREVFSFPRPQTMQEWAAQPEPLRKRLHRLPRLDSAGLRDCQISAIENLEASFKDDHPRALIQLATGSGKTYTAIAAVPGVPGAALTVSGRHSYNRLTDAQQASRQGCRLLIADDHGSTENWKDFAIVCIIGDRQ